MTAKSYDSSFVGIAGSNPAEEWKCVYCECCVLSEVSATDRSFVQRRPTGCVFLNEIDESHGVYHVPLVLSSHEQRYHSDQSHSIRAN